MVIVTGFGSEVTITAVCGKHQPKWAAFPLLLVQVRYSDDNSISYQYTCNLRAEGGMNAIDAAVDAVPELTLSKKELTAAMKAAE
jgi:hypothetical protein